MVVSGTTARQTLVDAAGGWALTAPRRLFWDLVGMGAVSVPVILSGVQGAWVLALLPVAFALLGSWALIHRSGAGRGPGTAPLERLTATLTFLAFLVAGLGLFFWLLGPAPHF